MIHIYHKKTNDNWCAVAVQDEKIMGTAYAKTETDAVKQALENLPHGKPFQVEKKPSPLAEKALECIGSILLGKDAVCDLEFEPNRVSPYAYKVLTCLTKVPMGYVTTYGALAKTVGSGPRAIGQVMRLNPFAPLVPCHRVIRSDFSIGGFGGGFGESVKTKRRLLQRENRGFQKPSKVATECGLLQVWPAEFLRKE